MRLKDFRADQKVTIEIEHPPFTTESYTSRIVAIACDRLVLYAPVTKDGPVPVKVGETLKIIVKGRFALFAFETEILAVEEGQVPLIAVKPPGEFKKIQRREFFRVPAHLPVRFRIDDGKEMGDSYQGTSVEISGGGLKLGSPVQLSPGTLLRLRIKLPDGEVVTMGEVVRGETGPLANCYFAGVRFTAIEERVRKRILDFVFDRQCEMRKLELARNERTPW